jgi:hypothetical protein
MDFDPAKYGAGVARILAYDGNGQRLMPLTCSGCSSEAARRELQELKAKDLFPKTKNPDAPMAGLWLYFSCFEEAHQLADACSGKDGDYWHAIVHRQEPDSGNAAYWFRRVSTHTIFTELSREAGRISERFPAAEFRSANWDPYAFIDLCERARSQPGSPQEQAALEIQRVEWQLLFDHCALSGQAKSGETKLATARPS